MCAILVVSESTFQRKHYCKQMLTPETITSPANPLLKEIRRAVTRGGLTAEGWCIAETFHLLEEALRSRCEVKAVFAAAGQARRRRSPSCAAPGRVSPRSSCCPTRCSPRTLPRSTARASWLSCSRANGHCSTCFTANRSSWCSTEFRIPGMPAPSYVRPRHSAPPAVLFLKGTAPSAARTMPKIAARLPQARCFACRCLHAVESTADARWRPPSSSTTSNCSPRCPPGPSRRRARFAATVDLTGSCALAHRQRGARGLRRNGAAAATGVSRSPRWEWSR